jgi:putative membrane protein
MSRRRWSLAAGVAVLVAAWAGPLPALAPRAFAAHMTMHVAVVALAAPLVALGLAGGRLDPVRRFPRLFPPIPVSVAELVVVWTWHAPALHHAARSSSVTLAVEQASFLAVAVAMWLSAFGGGARRRADRAGAGVVALLLTSMHMTLLGALLALALRPLYPHAPGGLGGMSALDDQHLGGAIMLLGGGCAYLAGALALTLGLLRAPRRGAEEAGCGAV